MLAFTALQLLACALLVSATTIVVRDPHDAGNRQAALLIYCGAFWAACQLLWNTARRSATHALAADEALGARLGRRSVRCTARFIVDGHGRDRAAAAARAARLLRVRRGLPGCSPGSRPGCTRAWCAPSWGWGYTFGPLYPLFFLVTVGSLALGASRSRARVPREQARERAQPGERGSRSASCSSCWSDRSRDGDPAVLRRRRAAARDHLVRADGRAARAVAAPLRLLDPLARHVLARDQRGDERGAAAAAHGRPRALRERRPRRASSASRASSSRAGT